MSKAKKLAKERVSSVSMYGVSKKSLGEANSVMITSQGSARICRQVYKQILDDRAARRVDLTAPLTRHEAKQYLLSHLDEWRQSTVDQHRQMLQKLICGKLPRYWSNVPTMTHGRAYTQDELDEILKYLSERNAFAAELAFHLGLRAHELHEVRDATERDAHDRPWHPLMFAGMTRFRLLCVTGKGGLRRLTAIPEHLHQKLLERRLPLQQLVVDRQINRYTIFDIGGGQAVSQAFSRASKKALGFSLGFHGLRHAYAQRRLATLLACEIPLATAMEVVAQELGHFRSDVTMAYLTPRGPA